MFGGAYPAVGDRLRQQGQGGVPIGGAGQQGPFVRARPAAQAPQQALGLGIGHRLGQGGRSPFVLGGGQPALRRGLGQQASGSLAVVAAQPSLVEPIPFAPLAGQIDGEVGEVTAGLGGLCPGRPRGVLRGVQAALVLCHGEHPEERFTVGVGRPQVTLAAVGPSQLHDHAS